jgi:hypothetical protein
MVAPFSCSSCRPPIRRGDVEWARPWPSRERRASSRKSGCANTPVDGEKTSVEGEFRESGWGFEENRVWFEESGDADMPSRCEDSECRSTYEPSDMSNMHSGDHFRSRACWFR